MTDAAYEKETALRLEVERYEKAKPALQATWSAAHAEDRFRIGPSEKTKQAAAALEANRRGYHKALNALNRHRRPRRFM